MVSEGDLEYAWRAEIMDLVMLTEECLFVVVVVARVDSEVVSVCGVVKDKRKRTKSVKVTRDICGPYVTPFFSVSVLSLSVGFSLDSFIECG